MPGPMSFHSTAVHAYHAAPQCLQTALDTHRRSSEHYLRQACSTCHRMLCVDPSDLLFAYQILLPILLATHHHRHRLVLWSAESPAWRIGVEGGLFPGMTLCNRHGTSDMRGRLWLFVDAEVAFLPCLYDGVCHTGHSNTGTVKVS